MALLNIQNSDVTPYYSRIYPDQTPTPKFTKTDRDLSDSKENISLFIQGF